MSKYVARLRRAKKARCKMKELGVIRLCVHRTPRHIYAQIISPNGAEVLAAVSTLDADAKQGTSFGGNITAAKRVGQLIAKKALDLGIKALAFDRSGFKYHGRVKALADAAREGGLAF